MSSRRQIPAAFSKGYVLCSPAGKLQPQTFGDTVAQAISAKYRKPATWEKAQARGWCVQFVFVRFFVPVFKATFITPEIDIEEPCDEHA
ncbi:hypothetical protein A6U97_12125 [Agrobacterium tumefaciens]|uniref:hypothetical protein n=1 Tax=Agrobacterium tumefaciens TaxID=358 RepID=UPI00080F97A2|nr:hypothetical protein A6U97_12125 [Agrobacterium tumefaciens]